MNKLVSYNSLSLSYLYLVISIFFLFVCALGIYLETPLLWLPSLIAVFYLCTVACLYEIKIGAKQVYINHIFYGSTEYEKGAFERISRSDIPIGILLIKFKDGKSYSFLPLIKMKFMEFDSYNKFIHLTTSIIRQEDTSNEVNAD